MSSKKKTKKKANPVGRPSEFKPEYCQMLIQYRAMGGSYEGFAGQIDKSKQTLYDWEKSHPEFLDAKKAARQKHRLFMDTMGVGLMSGKIKGNAAIWIFIMKNDHGLRDDPVMEEDAIEALEFVDD